MTKDRILKIAVTAHEAVRVWQVASGEQEIDKDWGACSQEKKDDDIKRVEERLANPYMVAVSRQENLFNFIVDALK